MYAGLVDRRGNLQFYDGDLRFIDAAGNSVVDGMAAQDYRQYIGEATVRHSFLKAPYFKPARLSGRDLPRRPARALNVAARCGRLWLMPSSTEYRQRFGKARCRARSTIHYARLVEIVYCLERRRPAQRSSDTSIATCAHTPA